MKTAFALTILFSFILSCGSGLQNKRMSVIHDEGMTHLKTNLQFLASDELEGREATKDGARTASLFLATRLQQMGIKPFGDDGTYFQNFNLQSTRYLDDGKVTLNQNGTVTDLYFGESLIPITVGESAESTELIFAGYGITDTITGYDDYRGLDVTGKTVICVYGVPKDSTYGKINRRLGSSTNKIKTAAAHGAAGAIVLAGEPWIYRWERLQRWANGEDIDEIDESNEKKINGAWLDSTTVKSLFAAEDSSYIGLFNALGSGIVKTGTRLTTTVSWDLKKERKIIDARNVVGIIEGTDPALSGELVTIGAHYDHVGMRDTVVYNGANDNGSGTVAVLEIARQLSTLKMNKRPVLILFYTAEEKGLIGSEYFTDNFDRMQDVLVNVNLDMIGRGAPDSLFVIGSGKLSSEFFNIVEESNKETVNFVYDYTLDSEGHKDRIYFRSDQWSFARKDIPVVFLTDNENEDYHRPTDDWDKIDYQKLGKIVKLAAHVVLKVANLDHRLIVDHANISGALSKGSAGNSAIQNPPNLQKPKNNTQSKK